MESAMETNKDAKVVSKKKQNIIYSEVKAILHIGKKKYGTDDFETSIGTRQSVNGTSFGRKMSVKFSIQVSG